MNRFPVMNPFFAGILLCLPLIILQACSTTADPQGWWQGNGPVIPHDSFPGSCSTCHDGDDWSQVRDDFEFDHFEETGVALECAHQQAQCLRCHNDRGPVTSFAASGCAGCHEDVHLTQLGRNCESCHGQETWRPGGQIENHLATRFPLVGAHAATSCFRCHPGSEAGLFSPTDTACESCHGDLAATVTSPNHATQGWVSDCQECHMATSWNSVGGFGHDDWPLTGAHVGADCLSCHTSGQFTSLATDCYSCHDTEYLGTTDPDHAALSFSTACQECHGTSTWQGARFNHVGITSSCVTCHLSDYQGTTNPDHVAQGFQTDCEDCHTTSSWQGGAFNHAGVANGCVDCHLSEYQATSAPNHQQYGIPTNCENCHTTNQWSLGSFSHSFPISSGNHSGFQCIDCHTAATAPSFSCIDCHTHRQSEMNSEHSGVGGYSWSSSACYSCHPNGTE